MSVVTVRTDAEGSQATRTAADTAYHRAWWSLPFYAVSLVVSLAIGGGLYAALDDGVGDPAVWVSAVAMTPALLVAAVPGAAALWFGRLAARLGRPDARVPVMAGLAIGAVVVAADLLAFLVG